MSKMNFDGLKNIKTPDEWIKKAAAIPETTIEEKPAVVPFWRNRALVAAASLVLVSALSLLLYLSFGSKSPVEVKPSSPATEIIWSIDENGETVATEIVIIDDGTTVQNGTQPTEGKSDLERIIDQIFGTESTSPTTAPGRGRTNPTTKTNPTESGKTNPTTKPGSTESGKTDPTTNPDPVNPPEQPTAKPPAPTSPPEAPPTVTPWEPGWDDPTDVPTETPTEAPSYPRTIRVSLSRKFSGLTADSIVYVSVFDSNGNRLGDSDPYSSQHIAQTSMGAVYITVSYTPADYGILPEDGAYRYEVYSDSGRTFATGSKLLSAT